MAIDTETGRSLTLTRRLAAAPERVWRAWTDPQTMMRWFAPRDDFDIPTVEADVRVGGRYRIVMKSADGALQPRGARAVGRVARMIDGDEAARAPAGDLHRPDVRLAQDRLRRVGADANHQALVLDAAAHVSADHEDEAAHHLLFRDVRAMRERPAHARGGDFIVGHAATVELTEWFTF